jgi:hypothetical protein
MIRPVLFGGMPRPEVLVYQMRPITMNVSILYPRLTEKRPL